MVALLDDRANIAGWALAQMTLGAGVLFGMARFSDDVDFDGVGAWLIVAYFASTLASGCYGACCAGARTASRDAWCRRDSGRDALPDLTDRII